MAVTENFYHLTRQPAQSKIYEVDKSYQGPCNPTWSCVALLCWLLVSQMLQQYNCTSHYQFDVRQQPTILIPCKVHQSGVFCWAIPNKIIKIEIIIFRNIMCTTSYLFMSTASFRSPQNQLHHFDSMFEAKVPEPLWYILTNHFIMKFDEIFSVQHK